MVISPQFQFSEATTGTWCVCWLWHCQYCQFVLYAPAFVVSNRLVRGTTDLIKRQSGIKSDISTNKTQQENIKIPVLVLSSRGGNISCSTTNPPPRQPTENISNIIYSPPGWRNSHSVASYLLWWLNKPSWASW